MSPTSQPEPDASGPPMKLLGLTAAYAGSAPLSAMPAAAAAATATEAIRLITRNKSPFTHSGAWATVKVPRIVVAGVAVAVIAAAGTALAVGVPPRSASQVATVPVDGHSSATLDVVRGTDELVVNVASLGGAGGTLLRASTPRGAPPPQLRTDQTGGTARSGKNELIFLSASSGAGPVIVTLNASVGWRLDFGGGTTRTVADLRGGRVAGITFTAGSDVVDLSLPRPGGTVPVVLAGGASQFLIAAPAGVPVRVTAGGGAGEVSLDGATRTGVAGGSVLTTPGWAPGVAGFDVDATAGAARVAVTRWVYKAVP